MGKDFFFKKKRFQTKNENISKLHKDLYGLKDTSKEEYNKIDANIL